MSKKKNTLQDLDEFLKQQAASLVSPDKLSEKVEEPVAPKQALAIESPAPEEVSAEKILRDLKTLQKQQGVAFRKALYDLIIKSLEGESTSPEDKMLINTALYLKSGDQWKDVIREFWRNK